MKQQKKNAILRTIVGIAALMLLIQTPVMAGIFSKILSLDPTFGQDGQTGTVIFEDMDEIAQVIVRQWDGKMVVAGTSIERQGGGGCDAGPGYVVQSYVAVARYTRDGVLDTDFGQGGIATIDFSVDPVNVADAALQRDGKILVSGSRSGALLLIRYNADGTLDDGFGTGGIVTTQTESAYECAKKIIFQLDHKILLAGRLNLVRYNPDGSLDTGYGDNGMADVSISPSTLNTSVDKDCLGRVVMLGSDPDFDLTLRRYSPNGDPDSFFGQDGVVTLDIPQRYCEVSVVKIGPDNKIVAGGTCAWMPEDSEEQDPDEVPDSDELDMFLVRFDSRGHRDLTFGCAGIVLADLGGYEGSYDIFHTPLGNLYVTGEMYERPESIEELVGGGELLIASFKPNGLLDRSFGNHGFVKTKGFAGSLFLDPPIFTQLQMDGKVLVCRNGFNVERYVATRSSDSTDEEE